ncbi:MAG: hypothetical protein AAGE79_13615 [Acinetobacter pittii]
MSGFKKILLAILLGFAGCALIFGNITPKNEKGKNIVSSDLELAKVNDLGVNTNKEEIVYPDNKVIIEAKRYIKNNLKDPDSAVFRNVEAYFTRDGNTVACGEVNAKNSYGGYTGFKWFIGTNNNVLFDGETNKPFIEVFKELCHSKSNTSVKD